MNTQPPRMIAPPPTRSQSTAPQATRRQPHPNPETIPHVGVGELTQRLASCVQHHFSDINVRGEVGSLKPWRNGHFFLTLKEGNMSISAVIWARDVQNVTFTPKVGDEVIVNGDLKVKPGSGDTALHIQHMIPTGEGLMQAEFERVCAEFKARGLLDRAQKLPLIPRCVGLITSDQSSAYHDFFKTRAERAPGVPVRFVDAVVQGRDSFMSVSAALRQLYSDPEVDVIALTRGGGSMEHLWDFNHPELCYLISQSPKPIIVGIGHEDNTLLAELTADVRGHTPTRVAQAVFPHTRELAAQLHALFQRLERGVYQAGAQHARRVDQLTLTLAPLCATDRHAQRLERLSFELERGLDAQLQARRERVDSLKAHVDREEPLLKLERAGREVSRLSGALAHLDLISAPLARRDELERALELKLDERLTQMKQRFLSALQQLEALSPLKTLARGYSLVQRADDGQVLTSTQQVNVGDELKITLGDGEVGVSVRDISPSETTSEMTSEMTSE